MCSGVWGGFWGVGRLEEGSALREALVGSRPRSREGFRQGWVGGFEAGSGEVSDKGSGRLREVGFRECSGQVREEGFR